MGGDFVPQTRPLFQTFRQRAAHVRFIISTYIIMCYNNHVFRYGCHNEKGCFFFQKRIARVDGFSVRMNGAWSGAHAGREKRQY